MNKLDLVSFLKSKHIDASLVDRLKIAYRPMICPLDELLELITPHSKVFDIGCGSGQFCLLVAGFTQADAIGGIEITASLIKNARELLGEYSTKKDIYFETYDGSHIPDMIANYDLVFMIDVVHHIPRNKLQFFVEQLAWKMSKNARLVVKDIDASSFWVFGNKLHDMIISGEKSDEWKATELQGLLERAGFKTVLFTKRRVLWYPHFTLVLQKIP